MRYMRSEELTELHDKSGQETWLCVLEHAYIPRQGQLRGEIKCLFSSQATNQAIYWTCQHAG